ncbi:MAG: prepilin-type N-terminal cleavage/methylation domain-containing protein [bacterium]|nr:prepilin-type N-terminal cleavage/methylation domain-containing protein [bacterium]
MNNNSKQTRQGFSLIELLIALTILAIAQIPVAYFYSKSLQSVEEASIRTRALMMANERIAEIRQMPYDAIRTNITPSNAQKLMLIDQGTMDPTTQDWTGNDFASAGRTSRRLNEVAGMFFYPLPLDFNPYQPLSQGYDNTQSANHMRPNNPFGNSAADGHLNINDGSGDHINFEYEPVGFYAFKVRNRNNSLSNLEKSDIAMQDRRTLSGVEPSIARDGGGRIQDTFRTGVSEEVDKYAIFGRRTIILDAVPTIVGISDNDGDTFAPDDDRDGGATALDPYPLGKGPDNKYQVVSRYGLGKLVIVQVFWLPRNPPAGYIQPRDLNIIEMKTFITPDGQQDSQLDRESNVMLRNNFHFITPGT